MALRVRGLVRRLRAVSSGILSARLIAFLRIISTYILRPRRFFRRQRQDNAVIMIGMLEVIFGKDAIAG